MKFLANIILVIYLLPVAPAVIYSQSEISGSLSTYVISFITGNDFPGEGTNDYAHPNAVQKAAWENTLKNIIDGNYSQANTTASTFGYRIVKFFDTTTEETYYILEKIDSSENHWGIFVYNPDAVRAKLFIQSPHPRHDLNTGRQGVYIFRYLGCRAVYVSGTHRCNSMVASDCDGYTTACGPGGSHKISDQPHTVEGPLQITTAYLNNRINNLVVIQPHGFGQDSGDPDAIISNGSRYTPSTDYAGMLRENMEKVDPALTFKVAHFDTDWTRFIAFTNTQGRLINGVDDPCSQYASRGNGRFIHIEQAYSLRNSTASRKKLSDAIAKTFPVYSSIAPGNWSSRDTWIGEKIPDKNNNVTIAPGQTITVTDEAECNSLYFEGNTSKISLSPGAKLKIYGDMILASESHNLFSYWGAGAEVIFCGETGDQVISGFSKTGFSTSFENLVVDKPSGEVKTPGNGMILGIGSLLDVRSGTFRLSENDKIEGRNILGSSAVPQVIVGSSGSFIVEGGTSHVRRGNAETAEDKKIGKITVSGNAIFGTSSSTGLNFGSVSVEAGGELELTLFNGQGIFNPGEITVKDYGSVTVETSSNFWQENASVAVEEYGIYNVVSGETEYSFPAAFACSGTVAYSKEGNQVLPWFIPAYQKLTVSGGGEKKLSVNTVISDSLVLNNGVLVTSEYELSLSATASFTPETAGSYILGSLSVVDPAPVEGYYFLPGLKLQDSNEIPGEITFTRTTGEAGRVTTGENSGIDCSWEISPRTELTSPVEALFSWASSFDNNRDISRSTLWQNNEPGWMQQGGTNDATGSDPRELATNLSSLGKWTVSDEGSPLPVEDNINGIVYEYSLSQNYPNPFNGETVINYSIAERGNVVIEVFNVNGEKVAEPVNSVHDTGKYSFRFSRGNIASGVYLYRLTAGKFIFARKLMYLK